MWLLTYHVLLVQPLFTYPLGQFNGQLCEYNRIPVNVLTLVRQIESYGHLVIEMNQPLPLINNLHDNCKFGMKFLFHAYYVPLVFFHKNI
jgi:hypothetical protein